MDSYRRLSNWYLAYLRRLLLQPDGQSPLTPAALAQADRDLLERRIVGDLSKRVSDSGTSRSRQDKVQPSPTVLAGLLVFYAGAISLCVIVVCMGQELSYIARTALIVVVILQLFQAIQFGSWFMSLEKRLMAMLSIAGNVAPHELPPGNRDALSTLEDRLDLVVSQSRIAAESEKMLVDFAAPLLCVLDTNGKVLTLNQSASRITGMPSDALVGCTLADYVASEDRDQFLAGLNAAIEKTEARFDCRVCFRGDSELTDLEFYLQCSKSFGEIFCMADDITPRKQLERFKQHFVSMITHDLRVPLGSLQAQCWLLRGQGAGAAQQPEILQTMERTIEDTLSLLNGLLDLQKAQTGKLEVFAEHTSVSQLAAESREALEPICQSNNNPLLVQVDVPPAACIPCDKLRIKQVIANLVHNATKFSKTGDTISLCVSIIGENARFAIEDHGCGLSREQLDALFVRQSPDNMHSTKTGYGLGMAICRTIVEAHAGVMSAESQQGEGSKFWFDLPLCAVHTP